MADKSMAGLNTFEAQVETKVDTAKKLRIGIIGCGFIANQKHLPGLSVIDEVVSVSDEDAYEFGRMIAAKQGYLAGISSGAALCAAVELAKRPENAGKNIVELLPDSGDRYLSTPLFQ